MTQTVSSAMKAPEGWGDLDIAAVDTVRALAADAVEKVGNGHPGTAISLAPAAYLLYQNVLRHDPSDPTWFGRDRFVLSAGHSSLTQYLELYLGGFGLELEDIESLRTWDSLTPGHPEYGLTKGVEMTTGPLGQGVSSAVGMAMAARRVRGLLDPDAPAGESPFDNRVYAIVSDGDLEEGVSSETSSIAGTQKLGNLTVLWDDNTISIEGRTSIAFSEDTVARYAAYGWHTQVVDWTEGGSYVENVAALKDAFDAAEAVTDKPSFIALHTIIGWPSPTKQDTGGIHGSAMGADEVAGLKKAIGFDPEKSFQVADEVLAHTRELVARGAEAHAAWDEKLAAWRTANTEASDLYDRLTRRALPEGWTDALPTFEPGSKLATRAASGKVLEALAPVLPELWGGSADLAGSNNTTMKGEPSFLPAEYGSDQFPGNPYGRTLHFGIREHGMGAILSGISLYGLTRPYGGTFFQFADYMRGSVRLASLMDIPVTYVWTHDSIGLGEDGPTHQPVEHLAAYRAIPNLSIVRPADATETAAAWRVTLERDKGPIGLVLTRQGLPVLTETADEAYEGVKRGAYVLVDSEKETPDVVLLASGSEVQLAVSAREQLAADGIDARVVSAPSLDWFAEQDEDYRESVLPSAVRARASIEAGIALSWYPLLGEAGRAVSLEHYGASADGALLFEKFGLTADALVAAAKESISAAG